MHARTHARGGEGIVILCSNAFEWNQFIYSFLKLFYTNFPLLITSAVSIDRKNFQGERPFSSMRTRSKTTGHGPLPLVKYYELCKYLEQEVQNVQYYCTRWRKGTEPHKLAFINHNDWKDGLCTGRGLELHKLAFIYHNVC